MLLSQSGDTVDLRSAVRCILEGFRRAVELASAATSVAALQAFESIGVRHPALQAGLSDCGLTALEGGMGGLSGCAITGCRRRQVACRWESCDKSQHSKVRPKPVS